jgi:hypothetical protein
MSESEAETTPVWVCTAHHDHLVTRLSLQPCPIWHPGACEPLTLRLHDGTMCLCSRVAPGHPADCVISCSHTTIDDWVPFVQFLFGVGQPGPWTAMCRWYEAYIYQGLRYIASPLIDAYAEHCAAWAEDQWQRWREGGPTHAVPDIIAFWPFIPVESPHGWTERTNDHHVDMLIASPQLHTLTPILLATYTHDPRRLHRLLVAWVAARRARGLPTAELSHVHIAMERGTRSPPPHYTCGDVENFIRAFPQCMNMHHLLHHPYCDGVHPDPAPAPPVVATSTTSSPNHRLLSPSTLLGLLPDQTTPLISPMTPTGRRGSGDEPPSKMARRRLDFDDSAPEN